MCIFSNGRDWEYTNLVYGYCSLLIFYFSSSDMGGLRTLCIKREWVSKKVEMHEPDKNLLEFYTCLIHVHWEALATGGGWGARVYRGCGCGGDHRWSALVSRFCCGGVEPPIPYIRDHLACCKLCHLAHQTMRGRGGRGTSRGSFMGHVLISERPSLTPLTNLFLHLLDQSTRPRRQLGRIWQRGWIGLSSTRYMVETL